MEVRILNGYTYRIQTGEKTQGQGLKIDGQSEEMDLVNLRRV